MSNVVPFTGQVDKDGTALNFFGKVLSPHGRYSAAIKKKRALGEDVFDNRFFESTEALWEHISGRDRDGFECYFTLATFGDAPERKLANVFEIASLSLDIDYGKEGHASPGYETYEEAWNALVGFCKTLSLPKPIVVTSGGGLQAHWPLEEALSRSRWLPYAHGLQAACHELDLKADHGLTVNAAHIMRVPGTSNRKLKVPRAVEVRMLDAGPYPLDKFAVLLTYGQAPKISSAGPPLPPRPMHLGQYAPEDEGFPNRQEIVSEESLLGCGVVAQFTQSGDCCEPAWMRLAALYHYVEDGGRLFHVHSSQNYPAYDRQKTQTKFDRAAGLTGPPLCEGFKNDTDGKTRDICLSCPHLGAISTPLALARLAEERPETVVEGAQEDGESQKKAPYTEWDLNEKKWYRSTYKNACIAIGKLDALCKFDTFHGKKTVDGEQLSDEVVGEVRERILTRFRFDPGAMHLQKALERDCERNKFNPIRDYLQHLHWDGVRRLDSWLVNYIGGADNELTRSFGRKVLLAGVRRVLQPGCKFDTMLVLEGPQGAGKSSAWRILAGDENFSDTPIKWDDPKQQRETVGAMWIHEVGELVGLRKAEVEAVKNFLSRQNDRVRAAYDRYETDRPRQGIVVGTINGTAYLNDPTGARRFWPVMVGKIDLEALRRDRDQLWAEAVQLEATGEPLELPTGLWGAAAEQQDLRRVVDPWEDILARVDGPRVSSIDLAQRDLKITTDRLSSFDAARIASVMRRLGWDGPKLLWIDGKTARGYEKSIGE